MRAAIAAGIGAGVPGFAADLGGAGNQPRAEFAHEIPSSRNLKQAFHFHRHAAGQGTGAHRGAGMAANIAKQLHKKIRRAVGDFGMLGEVGRGIDENAKAQAARHPLQIAATSRLHLRDQIESTKPGSGLAVLQRNIGAQLAE